MRTTNFSRSQKRAQKSAKRNSTKKKKNSSKEERINSYFMGFKKEMSIPSKTSSFNSGLKRKFNKNRLTSVARIKRRLKQKA